VAAHAALCQVEVLGNAKVAKKFPIHPANPERLCWGCDDYCPADSMKCGNGSDRTQHPFELFGENWQDWGEQLNPENTSTPRSPIE
jgi:hypothetical protein